MESTFTYEIYDRSNSGASVEISKSRFEELTSASKIVYLIFEIEDAFSILANAFLEFEEVLFGFGVKYCYQGFDHDSDQFSDEVRQVLNLKILMVLTASRIFEDHLHRRISAISRMTGEAMDMNPHFNSAFDGSFEYRVMCALRNHALHSQLPLGASFFRETMLSKPGSRSTDQPAKHRITIDPKISTREFLESDKIKLATKNEVKNLGFEYLDVKFLMRGFISALAVCHYSVREATEPTINAALEQLRLANNDLPDAKGEKSKFVSVAKRSDGYISESHGADYKRNLRILEVRQTWWGLKSIQTVYVSSEITRDKSSFPQSHPKLWMQD